MASCSPISAAPVSVVPFDRAPFDFAQGAEQHRWLSDVEASRAKIIATNRAAADDVVFRQKKPRRSGVLLNADQFVSVRHAPTPW
jgi:hypothetical protein